MKNYILHSVRNKKYDALLLCLSHENIFSFVEDLQHNSLIQSNKGTLLLDQVLVTENGANRFVALPYDKGKVDFTKAHNASGDFDMRQLSTELLKANIPNLQYTILTKSQRDKVEAELPF